MLDGLKTNMAQRVLGDTTDSCEADNPWPLRPFALDEAGIQAVVTTQNIQAKTQRPIRGERCPPPL